MFSRADLQSMLPEQLRPRVQWGSLDTYDVLLQQTATIAGGSNLQGNSVPFTLDPGYIFFHYGTSGDIFTPAALTVAAGGVISNVGQRWLWEPSAVLISSSTSGYQMPHVGQAGITFKVNNNVRSNGFQPFQTFCGPHASLYRPLLVPTVLIGQTPISYTLQNNAPASCGAQSNITLHTLRVLLT